ncbi:SRPBCC family protein [Lentisalinibacter sediminis]|uniref:SRPBCC family protein n=1 Tax=Lentisalinibacter sediminis TaxID=2992237 RepID=UPI00386F7DE0
MSAEDGRPAAFATLLLAVSVALAALPARGADLLDVSVEKEGERYTMASRTYFEAPPEAVFRVLSDYDRFERISSIFEDVRFIAPASDGTPRAFTLMKGCVLFFCKTIERIEELHFTPHSRIVAEVEPEHSDFAYGRTEWQFIPSGSGTEVHYRMEMEPGFWVPPLIGPYMMKRSFRSDAVEALNRIEALALSPDESREPPS